MFALLWFMLSLVNVQCREKGGKRGRIVREACPGCGCVKWEERKKAESGQEERKRRRGAMVANIKLWPIGFVITCNKQFFVT